MFSVIVLSDLHLDSMESRRAEYFLEALREVKLREPDVIACCGDLTLGRTAAAEYVREKLESSGLPLVAAPGNCDRFGTATECGHVLELVTGLEEYDAGDVLLFAVDSSKGGIRKKDRARIDAAMSAARGKKVVIFTHYPPADQKEKSRLWLVGLLETGRLDYLVSGHKHYNLVETVGTGELHVVRGLDPDKNKRGGDPTLAVLTFSDTGKLKRTDVPLEASGI